MKATTFLLIFRCSAAIAIAFEILPEQAELYDAVDGDHSGGGQWHLGFLQDQSYWGGYKGLTYTASGSILQLPGYSISMWQRLGIPTINKLAYLINFQMDAFTAREISIMDHREGLQVDLSTIFTSNYSGWSLEFPHITTK